MFRRSASGSNSEALQGPFVPDLNLIPPELTRGRLNKQERLLIMITVLLVIGAFIQFQTIGTKAVATGRTLLAGSLPAEEAATIEIERLQGVIQRTRDEIQENQLVQAELRQISIPWGDLLTYVYVSAPPGVTIETVRQVGVQVTITGTSQSPTSATEYRETLQGSPAIDTVDLKSINRNSSSSNFSFSFDLTLVRGEPIEPP